jgi:tRNA pseudouridine55 synthase
VTRGFLVVDKPRGISSNAVVGKVKHVTRIKKVGHAGTLDPLATGAVVVAIGPVTRLIRFIQDQPKEYLATAQFGVSTDSLDADGAVLDREPMDFTKADLEEVAKSFEGEIMQVPPMVSALKHQGRRLYELAREGTVIEREARRVVVDEMEITSVGLPPYPEVEFRVICGKGTYVRSLADDMAAMLGGSAHLTALRRTRIGSLSLEAYGISTDDLDDWESKLLNPVDALCDLPLIRIGEETALAASNGIRFVGDDMQDAPEREPFRVLGPDDRLVAVYRRDGKLSIPEVVLPS